MNLLRRLVRASLIFLLLVCVTHSVMGQVVVSIECRTTELAVRQPFTVWVRLHNRGSEAVNILPPARLGQNMEFMYYEVVEPDGVTVKRKHDYLSYMGFIDPDFTGEPLASGQSVEVSLNPALSRSLPREPDRSGFTFDRPGKYLFRVAYAPPSFYRRLWRPDGGGDAMSNTLAFVVRAPDATEVEMLDTYWATSSFDAVAGDDDLPISIDLVRMRSVLENHAAHPLADYLRFNLARGLLSVSITDDEAIEILEELRSHDFRAGEVEAVLAAAYSGREMRSEALAVLFDGIVKRPELLSNDGYMRRLVLTYYGSHDKVAEWEDECMEGQRDYHAGIELPRGVMDAVNGE